MTARGVRGALRAPIAVMRMTAPRTHREWAVGLISTLVTGTGGGAIAFITSVCRSGWIR